MNNIEELRSKIQEEFNRFTDLDENCELTDDELIENFWSDTIFKYNYEHPKHLVGFTINNNIVEIIEY